MSDLTFKLTRYLWFSSKTMNAYLNTMLSKPRARLRCTGSTALSVAITFGMDVMNVQKMLSETLTKRPYMRAHLLPQRFFTALFVFQVRKFISPVKRKIS